MTITEMIDLQGVDVTLAANTRASVLRELVNLAQRVGLLYDDKGLLKALEERETMCSTALPGGVAIPHPRQPMPYVSAEPFVCVARLSRGIGFGSPYRDLTRLFFLICCHDDRHHLRVLARLVRILDQGMIDQLMAVGSRDELLQMMIDKERRIVAEAGD
jgi:PTS system nitrogen regulatory IIA component